MGSVSMSDLHLAQNVQTMPELGITPDTLSNNTFDAFYDRPSDTIYLNMSSMWPPDFASWEAYVTHHVVPLLVHEHLHGTLYRLGIKNVVSEDHHWAIEKLEEVRGIR